MVARRAADRWYLGAGTDSEGRTVNQPLDFLEPGVTYEATVYADDIEASDPKGVIISTSRVTSTDTIEIKMLPAGGQAITFIPVNE